MRSKEWEIKFNKMEGDGSKQKRKEPVRKMMEQKREKNKIKVSTVNIDQEKRESIRSQ